MLFSLPSLSPNSLIPVPLHGIISSPIFPVYVPKQNFPNATPSTGVTMSYPPTPQGGRGSYYSSQVSHLVGLAQSNACLFLGSPTSCI